MKKFAFVLMGGHYTPQIHQARFETENQITSIFTVRDFEEAQVKLCELENEGYGAVELCGAFGEENARKLIELTHNRVAVGFVTSLPEQAPLFESFFNHFG